MRKHAREHGWEVYKEFVDEAESARSADRPAFQEMIATAKQADPPFDTILVWKLSRFARSREDSVVYKSLLERYGIRLVSVSEPVDDSPMGRLLEAVMEVIDEFYSLNLAQETVRGMKENARRGTQTVASRPSDIGGRRSKMGPGTRKWSSSLIQSKRRMCATYSRCKQAAKGYAPARAR